MNISLDFDGTYTRDPDAWDQFIDLMQSQGHNVYLVTMRYRSEANVVYERLQKRVDGIFCTGRRAKRSFMYEAGIDINVWIDDEPSFILMDAAPAAQRDD